MQFFTRKQLVRIAVIATLGLAAPALAYRVSPMIYDLDPFGPGATKVLRIENDGDKPITVEIVPEKRSFDIMGAEKRTPAEEDFLIFPPQAVIQPDATQAVRVQYIGEPGLTRSETYTVTVKQVPVQLPTEAQTGVQFLFNFSTLANVVPAGASADVRLESVTREADGSVRLGLRNAGTKYANLATAKVTLTGPGISYEVPIEAWREALGTAWLLPDLERVVLLPAELGVPEGVAAGTIVIRDSDR
ncbi:fimbrial biogenesis chaperone [Stakelama tenebrarum]|uniref:Molecular chaperone n=1 Tax=Stakelama tenebrarum TaxID=2711215 RepID=A0A6G6Y359_9SPHN|nr:fimbria/pilus periplasmic chaperone [Sphingosinithalassobacter tenebrarum]QIG79043.1 molecular chaperone [Sphingosinithalassobacter tenebrarum]